MDRLDGLMMCVYFNYKDSYANGIDRKVIKRNFDGGYIETWTHNDNVDGTMEIIEYNAEGNKIRTIPYIKGKKCGTETEYYCNGKKKLEAFFMDDKPCAEGDNPTNVTYYESGAKKCEVWQNLDGKTRCVTSYFE